MQSISADSTEYMRYHGGLPDGGPLYTETDLSNGLIVEPWNAASSLLFLIPAAYWLWRVWSQRQQYRVLIWGIVFLFLGGLGSTFFHAFRQYPFFLAMDVVPMQILMLIVLTLCWSKITPQWWHGVLVVAGSLIIQGIIYGVLPLASHTKINVGYAFTGLLLFTPLIIISVRTRYQHLPDLVLAIGLLVLALFFREVDARENFIPLPMGTHFLWHASSAIAAHFLARYLYWLTPLSLRSAK